MHARCRQPRGFTLLELVLVMIIACIAVAMAAPQLSGFMKGNRARDTVSEVLRITQHARALAARDAAVCRLMFDPQQAGCWIEEQEGEQFVRVENSLARTKEFPDGIKVRLQEPQGQDYIEFHPNGRTEAALIELIEQSGAVTRIACDSPAETFRVLPLEDRR